MGRVAISEASAKVRSGPPVEEEADLGLSHWGGEVPLSIVAGRPVADRESEVGLPASLVDYVARHGGS